jgi:hypothetical protein
MRELVGARIQQAREAGVLKKPREATLPFTFGTGKFNGGLMTASNESQNDSAWKLSSKTCMKLTSVKCTVENS